MTGNERAVVMGGEIPHSEAMKAVTTAPHGFGGVKEAVPNFTIVKDFTTFEVEYALIDGDIVLHFFPSAELKECRRKPAEHYWKVTFANVLNDVGQAHFNATAPRLMAKYTEELTSWWFKAQSYDHVINLKAFLGTFFEKMDSQLEPHFRGVSKS